MLSSFVFDKLVQGLNIIRQDLHDIQDIFCLARRKAKSIIPLGGRNTK